MQLLMRLEPLLRVKLQVHVTYTLIYSRVAIVVNLAGAGAATLFAAVAEISWEAEWIMSLALLAITFVLGFYTITKGKQLKQTFE